MITNIPGLSGANSGGYPSFLFIPVNDVLNIPIPINKIINEEIELREGKNWLTAYVTPDTLEFNEPPGKSDAGPSYRPVIEGFVPGDTEELANLMDEMEGYRYLILLKTYSGEKKLIGTLKTPLFFTSEFIGGSQRSKAKGYNIKFFGSCIYRSPFYLL